MPAMGFQVQFIKSAAGPIDYPPGTLPEIAMVGRSNAGKSSFINAWMGRKIAHVSGTPGKTRLLQFFNVAQQFFLVDMPGYGFAKRSKDEMSDWQGMIEDYFESRENLRGVLLIMDVRRDWELEEQHIADWLGRLDIPLVVILNKADKLSRAQLIKRRHELIPKEMDGQVFFASALKKMGFQEIEDYVFAHFMKKKGSET